MNLINYSQNQPFSAAFRQITSMQSPTLKIGLDCLNSCESPEEAIQKYPAHSAEIIITSISLLFTDEGEQSDEKNEIFEVISKLISTHDQFY